MRDELRLFCDEFIQNRDALKALFKWESAYIWPVCGISLTTHNTKANEEKLLKCNDVLKSSVGAFSTFRGYVRLPMVTQLSMASSPKNEMENVLAAYRELKEHYYDSNYLPLAAVCVATLAQKQQYSQIATRSRELYDLMKKEHPFLTSAEDSIFAVLLSFSHLSNDQLIRKNEECHTILKDKFGRGNPTQSLSHVLSLYDGDSSALCQRTFEIYDSLKRAGRSFSRLYELTILGVLAGEGNDVNSIVCDILDVDDYLSKQKGYGFFGLGKQYRLTHAAMIVSSLTATGKNVTTTTAASISSAISVMAAQQAALCACVMAAVAANNAT